jgi:hypothetical protein
MSTKAPGDANQSHAHDGALPLDCAGHDGALDGHDMSRPLADNNASHQKQSGDMSPHSIQDLYNLHTIG